MGEIFVLFHTHLAFEFPEEIRRLREIVPSCRVVVADDQRDFNHQLAEADIIVTAPLPETTLAAASRLKLHIVPFAGVNRAPFQWYERNGVLLVGSHGNAQSVAERAVALVFAAAGRVVEFDQALRIGKWHRRRDERRPFEYWRSLSGSRVAILGTGEIGSRVARLLQPLAGEIVGARRENPVSTHRPEGSTARDEDNDRVVTAEDPEAAERPARHPKRWFDTIHNDIVEAMHGADVVVVTLPLTERTRGAIGTSELARTNNAVLVNVSRAEVIAEDALYTALTDGTLYAAGLDVWYRNPSPFWNEGADSLPGNKPFHTLSNVVLSPHAGSHSEAGKRGQLVGALAHLEEYVKTGSVRRRVDMAVGY